MNLQPHINKLYDQAAILLAKEGWMRAEENYFFFNRCPDTTSYIYLIPELLFYREGGQYVCHIWLKVKTEKPLPITAELAIRKAMKPFKDEDYSGSSIWINPFYTNGHWSNHALND